MKKIFILLIVIGARYTVAGQNIVQVEYFLDIDAGVGKNTIVTVTSLPDNNFSYTINVSMLAAGYHQLYMRAKDNNGMWSITNRKNIEVIPEQMRNIIISGEYFFDLDPGTGNAMQIIVSPQDSIMMQNFTAIVNSLSPGPHKIYVRFKDAYGKWSHTSRSTVDIVPVQTQNNLVKGEYYFDNDPEFGKGIAMTVSPQDSSMIQNYVLSSASLPVGPHMLYKRFIDSYGNWSQTLRRRVEVINNPDTSNIVSLEYFYKTDPGFSRANPVQLPVTLQNGNFTFSIPSNKIPAGLDTLFIRAKDSINNNWSLTVWKVDTTNIILPLALLNFSADKLNSSIQLQWQTENEFNTAFFNVERSTDGISYINLGKVNAKGNSIATTSYGYVDNISNFTVAKLFYRLQQADNDGKTTYSKVVSINLENKQTGFIIFPNPASDYITIIPGSKSSLENATLIITDISGHVLIKQKITNPGSQKILLSSLAKGLYSISIITPEKVQTEKLIIK